jgi:hypothetical protein
MTAAIGRAASLRRALAVLAATSGIACAALVAAMLAPPRIEMPLAPADIHPLRGHAFATTLPAPPAAPWLALRGDDHGVVRSRLELREDGRPLPSPHASQAAVERSGAGRFLHLRASELYFSTSDGSDPRSNGRRYVAVSPATPSPALAAVLFALFAGSAAWLGHWPAAGTGRGRLQPSSAVLAAGALALALGWLAATWAHAPLVVDTGDGGNVSSIAAGWMHRERFADDPVFGSSANSGIYLAAGVASTIALGTLAGDIGQGWLLAIVPILVAQLAGFYRLGLRVFEDGAAALALALASVPPVYVFGGEVWGLLAMPLTRAWYGAAFPWIVLLMLARPAPRHHAAWVMAACGAAIYLHPPSAPTVALACWLALAATPEPGVPAGRHALRMVGAAAVFVAFTLPFAAAYLASFPSGAAAGADTARSLAADALAARAGRQYYEALEALRQLAGGGANPHRAWGWRWVVWLAGLVALWRVPRLFPQSAPHWRRLRWLLAGLLAGSAGLAALDQAIAGALGRRPVQIDLIRNLRFIVPVLLVGAIGFAAAAARSIPDGPRRAALRAAPTLLVLAWWASYPTPLRSALAHALTGETTVRRLEQPHDRAILARLAAMPPHTAVLPLPLPRAESATELVGLAVRYGALQPVAFLQKDLNLLAYSSSPLIPQWLRTEAAVQRAEAAGDAAGAGAALREVLDARRVDVVLLHVEDAPAPLAEAVAALGDEVAREGPWRLVAPRGPRR